MLFILSERIWNASAQEHSESGGPGMFEGEFLGSHLQRRSSGAAVATSHTAASRSVYLERLSPHPKRPAKAYEAIAWQRLCAAALPNCTSDNV